MALRPSRQWVVFKFGGTSVSTFENWKNIRKILEEALSKRERPLVVCSALKGVSNLLESMITKASSGQSTESDLKNLVHHHEQLAGAMELETLEYIAPHLEKLEIMLSRIRHRQKADPYVRAEIMASGELMSTTLGVAWLQAQGLSVTWRDARDLLVTERSSVRRADDQRFLSATCSFTPNGALQAELDKSVTEIVMTQGFIARDPMGGTSLLGRGGSDTSASYFAAQIQASRLEIWTDVPGMFTANPQHVNTARLISELDYDEAEALAYSGAKVLHPKCIEPVRSQKIPLYVRCTSAPELPGTTICHTDSTDSSLHGVKAISSRSRMYMITATPKKSGLVSAEFISEVADSFRECDLHVDSISTSNSKICFTCDPSATALSETQLNHLLSRLRRISEAQIDKHAEAVSLVGRKIRSTFHKFGSALMPLEESDLQLVAPSADDLNFTFIVGRDQANDLVKSLHDDLVLKNEASDRIFGPTWKSLNVKMQLSTAARNAEEKARQNLAQQKIRVGN